MFKFKKIALAASIFTATALSLAAFAACGEPVKGDKGDKGDKGETGATGAAGAAGKDGKDGKDGVGISDITVNEDGKLVITLTDGNKKTVDMPQADAPVAEEHKLAKDPITIINNSGEAGTLEAGQKGTGLYVCEDCGDVFAKSAHAHNLTAWASVTTDKTGMTYERDCLVFKNGISGDTEKVADEHQTIKMISYSDIYAADGSLNEGWTREKNGDLTKKVDDTKGMWVVSVKTKPSCNAVGAAKIAYLTANGAETTDSTYTGYKTTAIVLDGENQSSFTDAQKKAVEVPVTDHYFDITGGTIIFEGMYPNKTVDGAAVKKTADEITAAEVAAATAATKENAQGDNNTIKAGFNKACYFVVCSNCADADGTEKAVKVFDTTVTTEVTKVATCADKQETDITATMKIVAGDKTFTKTAVIKGVETGATIAPQNVTGHVYFVYDATGSVVAYNNGDKFYKTSELKDEITGNDIKDTWSIFRKERDVVAVNCVNCSGGRIAFDIPKAEVEEDNPVWTKGEEKSATETAGGTIKYSHDFNIVSGIVNVFTTEVKTAKLTHSNVFTPVGADAAVSDTNVNKLTVGTAVNVTCANGETTYGATNKAIKNNNGFDADGNEAASDDDILTYDTVTVTKIDKAVKTEKSCTAAKVVTYTVTVTAKVQKKAEDTGFLVWDKNGAPVWDETKTVTYTQSYDVTEGDADTHKYEQTVVAYPTNDALGLLEYKCSKCGDVYYCVVPTINKNTTNNKVAVVDTKANCTTAGESKYSASYIEAKTTEDQDKLDLNDRTYANDAGSDLKVEFKKAGDAALGHEMGAWKPATGANTNYKWIRTCERVQANGTLDGYLETSNAETNPDAE